jgi:hypothetical protein
LIEINTKQPTGKVKEDVPQVRRPVWDIVLMPLISYSVDPRQKDACYCDEFIMVLELRMPKTSQEQYAQQGITGKMKEFVHVRQGHGSLQRGIRGLDKNDEAVQEDRKPVMQKVISVLVNHGGLAKGSAMPLLCFRD